MIEFYILFVVIWSLGAAAAVKMDAMFEESEINWRGNMPIALTGLWIPIMLSLLITKHQVVEGWRK